MSCIWLLYATFIVAHNAYSSALLLVARPIAYFIIIFLFVVKLMTSPSKKAQGISLFISGSLIILVLVVAMSLLCSCTLLINRDMVISGGVHELLKIALFLASHILKMKRIGNAS